MKAGLKKRAHIVECKVDEHVWGLYDVDTGKYLFIDSLDHSLLKCAESVETRKELESLCAGLPRQSHELNRLNLKKRLDQLFAFGALVEETTKCDGEVLLIDPPAACEQQVGAKGPAMALCYLSAALEDKGLSPAKILDLRSVSPIIGYDHPQQAAYFTRYASQYSPKIIGITAVSATIENALFISRLAKTLYPDSKVVLGGPHVSYTWEDLLAEPSVDVVVRGEGELPFPRVVERILNHTRGVLDFSDIPGASWRDGAGKAVSTGWSPGVECLDNIRVPDVYDGLLNRGDYAIESLHVMSSRGCPFTCSFCSTATFTGRRVRYRSAKSVLTELEYYYHRYGLGTFVFDDDIFTVNRKRTLELCGAIESLPFMSELRWGCNTRLDCIDNDIIDALYRAGCRHILFGVESGDIDVQTRFAKGKRGLDGFQHKIERLLELGIVPDLNFIIGLPGEDKESIAKIGTLITNFPEVPCAFNFLAILPGTPLERQMAELGISFVGADNKSRYSMTAPTVNTPTMSYEGQIKAFMDLQWFRQRTSVARKRQKNAQLSEVYA